MKGLEVVLIFSLLSSQVNSLQIKKKDTLPIQRTFNSKLNNFLEVKLREMMKNGDEKLGIPILDPLQGYEEEFDLKLDKIMIAGKASEYHVARLSSYKVKESKINIFKKRIDISMHFPTVTSHGLYNFDGFIGESTRVFGSGHFNATWTDFSYSATIKYSIFGGIHVTSINLKISLGELNLSMTGLMNDNQTSWILSEIISVMVPEVIDEHHDQITAHISARLIEMANEKLAGKSLGDLVAILS